MENQSKKIAQGPEEEMKNYCKFDQYVVGYTALSGTII